MCFKKLLNKYLTIGFIVLLFHFSFNLYSQQKNNNDLKTWSFNINKQFIEYIGGLIDKSSMKVGFLNNGRFCPPMEYLPDLPNAVFDNLQYLNLLDLWIGIPSGPWTPQIWDADSQKYVSLGPTVSGTIFEPMISGTDWSTIVGTQNVLYTRDLKYSSIYEPSNLFDFILTPTSEYELTWGRDPLTGFRKWPGRWKTDPETNEPIEGLFFGDQDILISFDDKTLSDQYYPNSVGPGMGPFSPQRGYPIGAEVLAQVVGFKDSFISNMVIFDLLIINTADWDYQDVYFGIYYKTARTGFKKTRYIKNEYNPELDKFIAYNLSYSYPAYDSDLSESSYFAVQFLRTPLAGGDQIDNDGDGFIDESEGEELGLTGWHFFDEENFEVIGTREKMQYQILAGDTSGLKRIIDHGCFFSDSDGNLDLSFDSPSRITIYRRSYYPYPYNHRGEVYQTKNVLSCGPINWASGDTLNFVFGILAAENLTRLKYSALMAHKIVQSGYAFRTSPPPPTVTAVPQNGKVTLYWDNSVENIGHYLTGYQNFEGYKIYRTTIDPEHNQWGEPINDSDGNPINFVPIARCDLDNGINGYELVYPHQKYGDDTGLFHSWTDTTVTNGVAYWYSVCSYDHGIVDDPVQNPGNLPLSPMNECPKGTDPEQDVNLVKVVPGVQASDYELPTARVEQLEQTAGNGQISPYLIDPYQITGHDYLITFEDTTFGYAAYNLYDETEGKMLFEKVTSTNGEEGLIFDGIQLYIQRYNDMEVLNERTYWYNYETGENSECTWNIHGGKLTWDPYPYEYDIIFTDKMDTSVFMKRTAPFEVWNTILDQQALWDIYWNYAGTDTTDSLKNTWSSGDMIYIWDEFNEENKFTLRITISERSIYTYQGLVNNPPKPGDAAHIALKRPFITGDQYRIQTSPLVKKQVSQTDLNEIKVVPNPYVVEAAWELGRNDSRIQFIHLPSECTIHIYTMAGDKVRTLTHNNPNTNYEFWDLLNFSNLKVSYGLYVYVVETPDGKATTGKFVILR